LALQPNLFIRSPVRCTTAALLGNRSAGFSALPIHDVNDAAAIEQIT